MFEETAKVKIFRCRYVLGIFFSILLLAELIILSVLLFSFEILGMHRHVEHRVDYMEWAPGLT